MINYDIVAQGLLRLTNWFSNHGIWNCGMCSSMEAAFEEAYEVRALIHTERVLGLGHIQNVAHTFCDLMVSLQGVHETDMYDMGYGYERNKDGMVSCSCVADCSSVARAIIDTVKAYPGYYKNDKYIESLRKFIDHVLGNYITKTGVIGVGILNYMVNPMPEYWCANALFSQALISFAELTGEEEYYDAAVPSMEFLATFNYKDTDWKEWTISPPMMILYTSEGILEGLTSVVMKEKLNIPPGGVMEKVLKDSTEDSKVCFEQAANRVRSEVENSLDINMDSNQTIYKLLEQRWNVFVNWLYKNQDANGLWKSPSEKDYRSYEPGLSWSISKACYGIGTDKILEKSVERQLNFLLSQEAKTYFGLFCVPFTTALAHLSFAYIAEKCMEADSDRFEKALADAQKDVLNKLW